MLGIHLEALTVEHIGMYRGNAKPKGLKNYFASWRGGLLLMEIEMFAALHLLRHGNLQFFPGTRFCKIHVAITCRGASTKCRWNIIGQLCKCLFCMSMNYPHYFSYYRILEHWTSLKFKKIFLKTFKTYGASNIISNRDILGKDLESRWLHTTMINVKNWQM